MTAHSPEPRPVPSAEEILSRTRSIYSSCSTYVDTGEIVETFIRGPFPTERHTVIKLFSTAFVRPDQLRFEYCVKSVGPESEWDRHVVWTASGRCRVWWALRPDSVENHRTIASALGGCAGVSGGTSILVPSLLLPFGQWSPEPQPGVAAREDFVDGRRCWVIQLKNRNDSEAYWIEQSSGLILEVREVASFPAEGKRPVVRRILAFLFDAAMEGLRAAWRKRRDHSEPLQGFRVESITRYRPTLDSEVDPARFTFDPPIGL